MPASHHVNTISIVGAVCLLFVYATWVVPYLRSDSAPDRSEQVEGDRGEDGAGPSATDLCPPVRDCRSG